MKFYRNDLNCETFTNEVSSGLYAETQEGFNLLANEINARIDSSFFVKLEYNQATNLLGIVLKYVGCITRSYYTCIKNNGLYDNVSRIEDILTAFACGLGFSF